jgi:hypothetical protein
MKYLLSIPVLLICISGCYKDITINEELNHDPSIHIECILYPGEKPKLYLNNSNAFFSEKVTPQQTFVRNAEVIITTDDWSESLKVDSTFDKFRCRWSPYYVGSQKIEQGKSYTLNVAHNGNTYEAETTISQAKVNLDSIVYTPEFYDLYGGHDGVVLYFQDAAGEANYYRFQMDRWIDSSRYHAHVLDLIKSPCVEEGELFLTHDYGRNIVSDGVNDGNPIAFNAEVSFEYLEGDTAIVYLLSLDEQSAKYYKDLDDQLQSILNPFVEPSFIHSTIEGTLGVFGSAVRSDPIQFIYPQDNP